ncbi:SPOR domain-containing protein [uncultured Marinobacter sp.]|uniref:SPOR domain-containing protein n=1 Tax=uncultured Marinobacter sp. TaxID=187379 RepID=UPI0030D9A438
MDGLKQRIIGALVLISLAVIFVPMMFDEPHDERSVRSLDIPEEPPFPTVDLPEPEQAGDNRAPDYHIEEVATPSGPASAPAPDSSTDSAAAPAPVPQVAPPTTEETPAPGADAPVASEPSSAEAPPAVAAESESPEFQRSLEGAWVLQLGSFGSQDNARRLRDNVRERGYGAHLQEVTRGDSLLIRVFSGPFAEKEEAERAKQILDEAFGVNSLVTRGAG